jgi:hypothetical protein
MISEKQSFATSQGTRKGRTKPKIRRKEVIKIRTEISELETKKAMLKINGMMKSWFFEKIKFINP